MCFGEIKEKSIFRECLPIVDFLRKLLLKAYIAREEGLGEAAATIAEGLETSVIRSDDQTNLNWIRMKMIMAS